MEPCITQMVFIVCRIKKIDEAKKSFENKPQSFGDFADIEKHPSLKTKADTILNK